MLVLVSAAGGGTRSPGAKRTLLAISGGGRRVLSDAETSIIQDMSPPLLDELADVDAGWQDTALLADLAEELVEVERLRRHLDRRAQQLRVALVTLMEPGQRVEVSGGAVSYVTGRVEAEGGQLVACRRDAVRVDLAAQLRLVALDRILRA